MTTAAGPGKYDDLATYVREESEAEAVMVIVLNGNAGDGFSVQCSKRIMPHLAAILASVVDGMRTADMESGNEH